MNNFFNILHASDNFWFGGRPDNSTVNVVEVDGNYIAEFLIPGREKEDISVQTTERAVTVSVKAKKDDRKYHLKGFSITSFDESVVFRSPISVESAELKDGILRLKINTVKTAKKQITIT